MPLRFPFVCTTVTGAVHYTAGATPLILQDLCCKKLHLRSNSRLYRLHIFNSEMAGKTSAVSLTFPFIYMTVTGVVNNTAGGTPIILLGQCSICNYYTSDQI